MPFQARRSESATQSLDRTDEFDRTKGGLRAILTQSRVKIPNLLCHLFRPDNTPTDYGLSISYFAD